MRVDFFLQFSYRLFLFFSLSLLIFLLLRIYRILFFGLACSLRQAGLWKKDKVKVYFQNSIFKVFFFLLVFESFWCPPCMCLRTDTLSKHGQGTGTYKEIKFKIIRDQKRLCGLLKNHCQQFRKNTLRLLKDYKLKIGWTGG